MMCSQHYPHGFKRFHRPTSNVNTFCSGDWSICVRPNTFFFFNFFQKKNCWNRLWPKKKNVWMCAGNDGSRMMMTHMRTFASVGRSIGGQCRGICISSCVPCDKQYLQSHVQQTSLRRNTIPQMFLCFVIS
jgi:hypothetical protein